MRRRRTDGQLLVEFKNLPAVYEKSAFVICCSPVHIQYTRYSVIQTTTAKRYHSPPLVFTIATKQRNQNNQCSQQMNGDCIYTNIHTYVSIRAGVVSSTGKTATAKQGL